ncbi:MAG: hypothetical protein ACM3NH_03145 [Candidatus Saccharibacteria bacterium]
MIRKILYWSPRVLSILFVLFISIFAFDVFEGPFGWQTILAFFLHLVPALLLSIVAWISWKLDLAGALLYLILAALYVLLIGFDRHWSWYLGISGPALLTSALFFLDWRFAKDRVTGLAPRK